VERAEVATYLPQETEDEDKGRNSTWASWPQKAVVILKSNWESSLFTVAGQILIKKKKKKKRGESGGLVYK